MLGVKRQKNLGIRSAAKDVALGLKFSAELTEIVNFSIKGDGVTPVHCAHGLMPCGAEIEDGKSHVRQMRHTTG
jgi:hypothetical protein